MESPHHARAFLYIALLAGILPFCHGCGDGADAATGPRLLLKSGTASVQRGATTLTATAGKELSLSAGDRISVGGEAGAVALLLAHGQYHILHARAQLEIKECAAEEKWSVLSRVTLVSGFVTFCLEARPESKEHRFRASAGTVLAAVKGTKFCILREEAQSTVTVLSGQVDAFTGDDAHVATSGAGVPVTAGRKAVGAASGAPQVQDVPAPEIKRLEADYFTNDATKEGIDSSSF